MNTNYENTKQVLLNNLHEIERHSSKVTFKPGQIIFYKGHVPYGLYILTEGTIEINYNKKSSEKVRAVNALGVNSFIEEDCFSGTAKALSLCTVAFLSKNKYNEIINQYV